MKLHRALSSSLSTGLFFFTALVGCAQKDFTAKSLSSHLTGPEGSQCAVPKSSDSQPLVFTSTTKVRIEENGYGEMQLSQFDTQSLLLPQGRELVVVTDDECLSTKRATGVDESLLTDSVSIRPRLNKGQSSHLVKLPATIALSTLSEDASSDPCVVGVSENVVAHVSAQPNDPQYSQQKHLPNIKAPAAYDVFFADTSGIKEDVVIAIVDSGVELSHEDLSQNLWVNTKEIAGNGVDDDKNGYVDDVNGYNFASANGNPNPQPWEGAQAGGETHGTHVAGLAAAKSNNNKGVAGVNGEKSKIMALNVFGAYAGAQTPYIDDAVRYAADNGAHVINMSLGGPGRAESMAQAIRYAVGKGVTVIVAAGNNNVDISSNFFSPASFGSDISGMLSIGAIDSVTNAKCSFSNHNTTRVEMGAPGCNGLFATVIGNKYQSLQGTSMASPVTAGAASLAYGLIKARSGKAPTPAEVEDVMKAGSRVENSLISFFRQGRTVDLMSLADEINKRYGGANPPTDPPPPGEDSKCP